jgi:hypothetical protein
MLNIHGHPEYGTVIEWHDSMPPPEWTEQYAAFVRASEAVTAPRAREGE